LNHNILTNLSTENTILTSTTTGDMRGPGTVPVVGMYCILKNVHNCQFLQIHSCIHGWSAYSVYACELHRCAWMVSLRQCSHMMW